MEGVQKMTILEKVKLSLRIADDNTDFDTELNDVISAAQKDLGIAGIVNVEDTDALIIVAICTYAHLHFGEIADITYARLKASYDEQKAQLSMATGYTDWGGL